MENKIFSWKTPLKLILPKYFIDKGKFFLVFLQYYLKKFIKLKTQPLISVILTTRNNLDYLKPCIESLLKQKYKNYEIIVINQGGNDKTKEFINSLNSPKLRYKYLKYFGKFNHSLGRNEGIKLAKGDIITCIDGDIIFNKNYLKNIAYTFSKNRNIFYECNKIQLKNIPKSFSILSNLLKIEKIYQSYGATQAMIFTNFGKLKYDKRFEGAYCFDDELRERAKKNGLEYYCDISNIILHPCHERTIKGYFDQVKKNRKLLERVRNGV